MTLVEFLRARLDEDEQVARAARSVAWRHDGRSGPHEFPGSTFCTVIHPAGPFSHDGDRAVCGSALVADAHHIARHDPARVLAEVAAKRQQIDMTFRYEATIDGEWGCCHEPEEIASGRCSATPVDEIAMLRLLALPHVAHSDYREEWKP